MRSSLILSALASAAVAAGAAYAAPKPAPVPMKPKPVAAASSSSASKSSSSSSSSAAAAKPKLPDYQTAYSALLEAQKLAKIDPTQAAGSSDKLGDKAGAGTASANSSNGSINMSDDEKAQTEITQALSYVKSAANADKVSLNDKSDDGADHNLGSGAGHGETPEGDLSSASGELGKAHEALDTKGTAPSSGAQRDIGAAEADITSASGDIKLAENQRPNYAEVADKLAMAETALNKIPDTPTGDTLVKDKTKPDASDPGKDKTNALTAVKQAEGDVASIAKAEHLSLPSASHGSSDGMTTGVKPGDGLAKPGASFTDVQNDLDAALTQLKRGDASPEAQNDLKLATDEVNDAIRLVKTAEDAGKSQTPTGKKGK